MYYNKYVGKCFLLLLSVTVLAIYPGLGAVCAEAEERVSAGQGKSAGQGISAGQGKSAGQGISAGQDTSAGQSTSAAQPNLPYSMVPGWNQSG